MRHRMNIYLPPELLKQIADLADRKKLSRSAIVEAAVASFLSPDGADRREAAFARRLDRLSRQVQRLERNLGIAIETLALFVRFWLTITPPLPADAQAAAQLKGRQRYEGFVEVLGQRLQKGQSLLHEIPEDVDNHSRPTADGLGNQERQCLIQPDDQSARNPRCGGAGLSQQQLDGGHHRPAVHVRHDHGPATGPECRADCELHIRSSDSQRPGGDENGDLPFEVGSVDGSL